MGERIIRIEDYDHLKGVHERIIEILNSSKVSGYNAVGILEMVKQEIFLQSEEGN